MASAVATSPARQSDSLAWICKLVAWFAHAPAGMRRQLVIAFTSLPIFVGACSVSHDDGPSPDDDDFGITAGNINEGAPDNSTLPDDNKADAIYPDKFQLPKAEQSAVKSQGSRGVCSIFASTAI